MKIDDFSQEDIGKKIIWTDGFGARKPGIIRDIGFKMVSVEIDGKTLPTDPRDLSRPLRRPGEV